MKVKLAFIQLGFIFVWYCYPCISLCRSFFICTYEFSARATISKVNQILANGHIDAKTKTNTQILYLFFFFFVSANFIFSLAFVELPMILLNPFLRTRLFRFRYARRAVCLFFWNTVKCKQFRIKYIVSYA